MHVHAIPARNMHACHSVRKCDANPDWLVYTQRKRYTVHRVLMSTSARTIGDGRRVRARDRCWEVAGRAVTNGLGRADIEYAIVFGIAVISL